jgi:hypothetical protein
MLFTVEYYIAFRKADESLVCSDKTCQFLQTCIITFRNKYNFYSDILLFSSALLISLNFPFVFKVFFLGLHFASLIRIIA